MAVWEVGLSGLRVLAVVTLVLAWGLLGLKKRWRQRGANGETPGGVGGAGVEVCREKTVPVSVHWKVARSALCLVYKLMGGMRG